MRLVVRLLSSALLASAPALAAAPDHGQSQACAEPVRWHKQGMGTRLQVVICPKNTTVVAHSEAMAAAEAVGAEFVRLEGLWSTWLPGSDLSRLNAAAGGPPVAVAAETAALLARAVQGSRQTQGLFDVTFAPLGALWQFDTPPGSHQPTQLQRVPTAAEISAKLALVGYEGLVVDTTANTAQLTRVGMAVHAGGIGKGAAVDRAVAVLRAKGFSQFAIQAGGDLYLAGRKGDRPWRVGIAHPRRPDQPLGSVEITDAAFSTSGDYERFALIDGTRYHHILDTRSGWPARASQSATVRAQSATDAEVLTKAAFVLGGAAGIALAEHLGAQAVIVDQDGRVWQSKALIVQSNGAP